MNTQQPPAPAADWLDERRHPMQPALDERFARVDPKRFLAEPAPVTAFGELA